MLSKLPPRERQIVDILYERGALPVADICDALPVQLSGSAVRAMLKRLEDKGFVQRTESDRGYLYSPVVSETRAKKSALSEIVRVFFNGSPASAASALARHVRQAQGRRTRRARADDRPRTQGERGPVMHVLIGIALKSLLIAGLTLGLLQLLKAARRRSARGSRTSACSRWSSWPSRRWCCRAGTSKPRPCSAPTPLSSRRYSDCDAPAAPVAPTSARWPIQPRQGDQPPRRSLSPVAAATALYARAGGDPAAHHLPCAWPADRLAGPAPTCWSTAIG